MNINLNFYNFIHKQIIILIILTITTGLGYIYMGWLYASITLPVIWYILVLILSIYGYKLYRDFYKELSIKEKDKWLEKSKKFLFIYFSLWTLMFIESISTDILELHYIAIATQLGASVVSATLLISQRRMAFYTIGSLMLPLAIYFTVIGEFYTYLLAFFTLVLASILMYALYNTNSYLLKTKAQSYSDYLTKLGNRHYFIETLEDTMKGQREESKFTFLLLVDLDHFKTINDSLGHDIGDELLIEVASRMNSLAKKYAYSIARLGGDEFCILSSNYATHKECLSIAENFAKELLKSIKKTYYIEDHHLYISASIGISTINEPLIDANTFLKEADIAMYEAKDQGRDGIIIFSDKLSAKIERKLEIERALHFSLKNNEISLNFQPQCNKSSKVIGCEVLVRWYNEKLQQIPPDEFIPLSENSGFIIELGYYILEESFKTLKEWDEKGMDLEHLSINISMRQMFHVNFIQDVQKLLNMYLKPELRSKIIFEITETSVADDIDTLINIMNKLKEFGIRFSMDDFGTGYSSLSYLKKLPIEELKIDKSFISDLQNNEQDRSMVKTILNIASNLELVVVAEGVEESSQKKFLEENSCDVLQGYFFSKPVSKYEFELLSLSE